MLGTWILGLIQRRANGEFLSRGEAEPDGANPGLLLSGASREVPLFSLPKCGNWHVGRTPLCYLMNHYVALTLWCFIFK